MQNGNKNTDHRLILCGLLLILMVITSYNLPFTDAVSRSPLKYAWNTIQLASLTLRGQAQYLDIVQDFVGFRALVNRSHTYPILAQALANIGLDWEIGHASTHPPTAYLLTAPVALLPWRLASTLWAWAMIVCLFGSVWCFTKSWQIAVTLTPILLLWPPIAAALSQFTLISLLASAVAYRFSDKKPRVSGLLIGLASLAKFFPGILMLPLVLRKRWGAVVSFIMVWIVALLIVFMLHPGAVRQYIDANFTASNYEKNIDRIDNAALVITTYRYYGWFGGILIAGLFGSVLLKNTQVLLHIQQTTVDIAIGIMSYFSVVLLPISWIYSLAPQLVVIYLLIFSRYATKVSRVTGITAFVLLFFFPAFGPWSVAPQCAFNMLLAIGILFRRKGEIELISLNKHHIVNSIRS